jgi:hypothetical protein
MAVSQIPPGAKAAPLYVPSIGGRYAASNLPSALVVTGMLAVEPFGKFSCSVTFRKGTKFSPVKVTGAPAGYTARSVITASLRVRTAAVAGEPPEGTPAWRI